MLLTASLSPRPFNICCISSEMVAPSFITSRRVAGVVPVVVIGGGCGDSPGALEKD